MLHTVMSGRKTSRGRKGRGENKTRLGSARAERVLSFDRHCWHLAEISTMQTTMLRGVSM